MIYNKNENFLKLYLKKIKYEILLIFLSIGALILLNDLRLYVLYFFVYIFYFWCSYDKYKCEKKDFKELGIFKL